MQYATPEAFRMALETRIGQLAAGSGAATQRLRKRVAFERLLARLQHTPESPWILKGAFALDLRFKGRARTTKDIDVGLDIEGHATPPTRMEVGRRLAQAVGVKQDDFFVFTIPAEAEEVVREPAARTYRFLVRSSLANRLFESFKLDVGVGPQLVVPADEIAESDTLAFAGIVPRTYRAFSLSQQFADKVHAFTFPWQDRENTRVKDLADLVLILETSPPDPMLL